MKKTFIISAITLLVIVSIALLHFYWRGKILHKNKPIIINIELNDQKEIFLNETPISFDDLEKYCYEVQMSMYDLWYEPEVSISGLDEFRFYDIYDLFYVATSPAIDTSFIWQTPPSNRVVKTEKPIPNGRGNDLNLTVLTTHDDKAACEISFYDRESNRRYIKELVSIEELQKRLKQAKESRTINLHGMQFKIPPSRYGSDMHLLIGMRISDYRTKMKHFGEIMMLCDDLGFGDKIPIQVPFVYEPPDYYIHEQTEFTNMPPKIVTEQELGCSPTKHTTGKQVVQPNNIYKRYGEGSFAISSDDDLLMFYDRRQAKGDLDRSSICMKKSGDNGETWSDETVVLDNKQESYLQPYLCNMQNGKLGMTYSVISLTNQTTTTTFFINSEDNGLTWSTPVKVNDDRETYTTGSHDLIQISNGRIISLVNAKLDNSNKHGTFVFASNDYGASWTNTTPNGLVVDCNPPKVNNEYGFWETSVVEREEGCLFLFGQTATGYIYKSMSIWGYDWSNPIPTDIPGPLAPIKTTKVPGINRLLMVRNPLVDLDSNRNNGPRNLLVYQISDDLGETWSECTQLEYVEDEKQWFDYPFIIWNNNTLHVAYRNLNQETLESSIYYQKFPISKFYTQPIKLEE